MAIAITPTGGGRANVPNDSASRFERKAREKGTRSGPRQMAKDYKNKGYIKWSQDGINVSALKGKYDEHGG
jgi:hypothetical protein